ncbi:AmpG family muropeptide MFS transporter [Phaeospirillum tilakii]|uniref:AmpG family muropeptide MFS transporter n=1 Tax=Phaeospirillum tilakii TaxID=741673 RepID=A0ABW5C6N2_9PROT
MPPRWSSAFAAYLDRRVLQMLVLGFASGLPLLLTFSTLSAWLKTEGIGRATIGAFALVGTPYALKFLWAPLIDRLSLPLLTRRLGRRRGWGLLIQTLLIAAVLALGSSDPVGDIGLTALLAVTVAVLSASQDVVIDAFRVETLDPDTQGPGAGAVQVGYRVAMLVSGAGALLIASTWGWFAAYATMAGLLTLGMAVFLFGREPIPRISPETLARERAIADLLARRPGLQGPLGRLLAWLHAAVVGPFADFMTRPGWIAILLFVVGYKLGEAMAGTMATPLYIETGFSLEEIAWVSKIFGFSATIVGTVIGGALVVRLGVMRALLLFGVLQSLGNLAYVVQAMAGHNIAALAACVLVENLTSGMAGSALVTYLSGLCSAAYTATQYALLSSLSAVGRTLFASTSGWLADQVGWVEFFLLTTVATLPALLILPWLARRARALATEEG